MHLTRSNETRFFPMQSSLSWGSKLILLLKCQSCARIIDGILSVNNGGIVVRILHHVHQLHDVCIFVPMRLFGEKAAWVYQAHDTVQLSLFYMMICLTHEKQTSCT